MNYVLQVVRGRSASTTLKLTDNVTSLGRHDDCVIRIKSAQVSRRHCELFEVGGQLMLRDLGSSNGTFVNGKRVTGEFALKHGDELTVGAVTLRVAKLGQPVSSLPASPSSKPKAGDTAVLEAVVVDSTPDEEEEFEMEFDDGEPVPEVEGIPLADDVPAEPSRPKAKAAAKGAASNDPTVMLEDPKKPGKGKAGSEDDAIADFLLDLDLDEDE
jgi:predicted component of type VI protein secretion system